MSPRPRRARSTAILAATILTTLGCGDADAPFAGTYVARIDETLIAVVVDDPNGTAVAYACDGRDGRMDPTAAWFNGTLAGGAAELTGPHGTLSVTLADGAASGELRLDVGDARAFDGPRSDDAALLWATATADGGDLLGGWIFDDDGTQRGAVLKRSIGDTSVTLMSAQTTSLTFEGTTLMIKTLTSPTLVE